MTPEDFGQLSVELMLEEMHNSGGMVRVHSAQDATLRHEPWRCAYEYHSGATVIEIGFWGKSLHEVVQKTFIEFSRLANRETVDGTAQRSDPSPPKRAYLFPRFFNRK